MNCSNRREEIRRQRIESEQRRRDELRDGYRRLKEALPISNQKSSKVSLLDRATTHIKYLEMTQGQLQTRLQQAENETARLRSSVLLLSSSCFVWRSDFYLPIGSTRRSCLARLSNVTQPLPPPSRLFSSKALTRLSDRLVHRRCPLPPRSSRKTCGRPFRTFL